MNFFVPDFGIALICDLFDKRKKINYACIHGLKIVKHLGIVFASWNNKLVCFNSNKPPYLVRTNGVPFQKEIFSSKIRLG